MPDQDWPWDKGEGRGSSPSSERVCRKQVKLVLWPEYGAALSPGRETCSPEIRKGRL